MTFVMFMRRSKRILSVATSLRTRISRRSSFAAMAETSGAPLSATPSGSMPVKSTLSASRSTICSAAAVGALVGRSRTEPTVSESTRTGQSPCGIMFS